MTHRDWYLVSTLSLSLSLAGSCGRAQAAPTAPAPAATPFTDTICPNAVAAVQKYTAMLAVPQTTIVDATAAAKAAADKYQACSHDRFSENHVVASQVASYRAAQFLIAVGHWQHLNDDNVSARATLQTAVAMLGQIIDWRKGSEISYLSNNNTPTALEDHAPMGSLHSGVADTQSPVHDAAVKLRDVANAEILGLAEPASPAQPPPNSASPSAGAPPAH